MNLDATVAVAALLAASLLTVGCNGDSPGAGSPDGGLPDGGDPDGGVPLTEADIAGLEGVYRLDSFTRNSDGCDAEGDDILDELEVSYGYAKPLEEGPFPELLLFRSCSAATAEDCAAEGAAAGSRNSRASHLGIRARRRGCAHRGEYAPGSSRDDDVQQGRNHRRATDARRDVSHYD